MILTIPVDPTLPSQEFQVELEGIVYTFECDWVDRDERWYLYLSDQDGNEIVSGQVLCLGINLLDKFTDVPIPPGVLFLWDTSNTLTEAGLTDLGDRVLLLYEESTGPN